MAARGSVLDSRVLILYEFFDVLRRLVIHSVECGFESAGLAPLVYFLVCSKEIRSVARLYCYPFNVVRILDVKHIDVFVAAT